MQSKKSFTREMRYLLSLPEGYEEDKAKRWPLIVFLHGAGERGDDLELVKIHGPPKLIEAGERYPFIVASPQLPLGEWWSPDMVAWLTKDLIASLRVDPERVYLTGLSMGGYGTWDTAMKYPELYAAIAPICGRGDPSNAWKLRHMPTWIFHGAKDDVVPIKQSEDMNKALKPYGKVKFTIYPEADHDSWSETYLNLDLYDWFLKKRRFAYVEAPLDVPVKRFVGSFKSGENSAKVFLKDGKLNISMATSSNPAMPLTYVGSGVFTFGDFLSYEAEFVPNKLGGFDNLVIYERRMARMKRV
jgi:predicted esterase